MAQQRSSLYESIPLKSLNSAEPSHLPIGKSLSKNSQTIHETILTNFNKTSSGKIFEKDLKDMYAMMIICLDLTEFPPKLKFRFNPLAKSFPFSFQLDTALRKMEHLNINVELASTTTSISYNIKPDLGLVLIKKFYDAKLLHSPADRTRDAPKLDVLLQPTPKGAYVVHDFCRKVGMKSQNQPAILKSNFNSMELFRFDRDPLTDKIVYSNYLLYLLFIKCFGDGPNIWCPASKPDPLPILKDTSDDTFSGFHNAMIGEMGFDMKKLTSTCAFQSADSPKISNSNSIADQKSPFYHRYFTNPESDAHIQYYVSSTGVRLFQDKLFSVAGKDFLVPYCVSGKAICQWLSDCTDVISVSHASEIANLLLKSGFFISVDEAESKFESSRDSFYVLTKLGKQLVHWPKAQSDNPSVQPNSSNFDSFITSLNVSALLSSKSTPHILVQSKISREREVVYPLSLDEVLKDPGMRYIFRKHLEKEFCAENLDSYMSLQSYEKKTNILAKLLKIKKDESDKYDEIRVNQLLLKFTNVCLSFAYHIFFTYLSSESPFVLNINYNLRTKINSVMIRPKSAFDSAGSSNETEFVEQASFVTFPTAPGVAYKPYSKKLNRDKLKMNLERVNSIIDTEGVISHSKDIKTQKILFSADEDSSANGAIESALATLVQVSACFADIKTHIFRLMQVDSFPKFMCSEIYREATEGIRISKT